MSPVVQGTVLHEWRNEAYPLFGLVEDADEGQHIVVRKRPPRQYFSYE